jgi:hypothetical protein
MTHNAVLLILDALAVVRLTRLAIADTIVAPLRDLLIGTAHAPGGARALSGEHIIVAARPKLAELLGCPWCISFWIAIGVVMFQTLVPTVWQYPAAILAFSAIPGLLAERL